MSRYDISDYVFGYGIEVESLTYRIIPEKFQWLLKCCNCNDVKELDQYCDMDDYVIDYSNYNPFDGIGDVFLSAGLKADINFDSADESRFVLEKLTYDRTASSTYLYIPYYSPWDTDIYSKEDVDKAITICIQTITNMTEGEIRPRIKEFIRYCDD